jgi:hypothetical protein
MAAPTSNSSGTQSATGSHTLATITTDGYYYLELDLNDMVADDILGVYAEAKATSGGTTRRNETYVIHGTNLGANKVWRSKVFPCLNELVFKVEMLAGGTISVVWEIGSV